MTEEVESEGTDSICRIVKTAWKNRFTASVELDFTSDYLTVNTLPSLSQGILLKLAASMLSEGSKFRDIVVNPQRKFTVQTSLFQHSAFHTPPLLQQFNSTCLIFSSRLSFIPACKRVIHVELTSSLHQTTCGYRFTLLQTPDYFHQPLSSHRYFCLEDVSPLVSSSELLLFVDNSSPHSRSHVERALRFVTLLPITNVSTITLTSLHYIKSFAAASSTSKQQIVEYIHHPIVIFSEGETFVLIFILPHELPQTQLQVDRWKKSCAIDTCQLTITYRIYTLPLPAYSNSTALFVLSEVQSFLRDFSTRKDVIFILHGLSTLRQFPQPALAPSTDLLSCAAMKGSEGGGGSVTGLIPTQTYGGLGDSYCLPSAIVLAERNSHEGKEKGLGVMIGIANELQLFISLIQQKYVSHNNKFITTVVDEVVHEVVPLNNKWLSIDTQHHIFYAPQQNTNFESKIAEFSKHGENVEIEVFKSLLFYFPTNVSSYDSIKTEILTLLAPLQNSRNNTISFIDFEVYTLVNNFYQQSIESGHCKSSFLLNLQALVATFDERYFSSFKWCSFLLAILYVYETTELKCNDFELENYSKFIAMRFVAMGTGVFKVSSSINFYDVEIAFLLLNSFLSSLDDTRSGKKHESEEINDGEGRKIKVLLRNAVQTCLTGLSSQFQSVEQTRDLYQEVLDVDSFDKVKETRETWDEKRKVLLANLLRQKQANQASNQVSNAIVSSKSENKHEPRMIYLTYASSMTEGLENLLFTAQLAGVNINIVGLDKPYDGYLSKMTGIDTFLKKNLHKDMHEDDILLFMDAYDVLVFPKIRKLHEQFLTESLTPIVCCAEAGRHPENFAGYGYPHPYTTTTAAEDEEKQQHGVRNVKFLNSGCVLGRVGDIHAVFTEIMKTADVYRDDQLAFTRMYLQNPSKISIDVGERFFVTGFKQGSRVIREMRLSPAMEFHHETQNNTEGLKSVPLFHANNLRSNHLYSTTLSLLKDFHRRASSSSAALEIFKKALWCVADGNYDLARELLVLNMDKKMLYENDAAVRLLKYIDGEKLHLFKEEKLKDVIHSNNDDGEF